MSGNRDALKALGLAGGCQATYPIFYAENGLPAGRGELRCHLGAGHDGPHRTTTPAGEPYWFPER